ncbi:MAG TPA: translation initiation factor IF-2, partial [Methanomicrobiales archaeon]|nr:translation initiation factor IF-2 [Methanomicrobiales archaeon]
QHIGATLVPLETIRKMSGTLGKLDIQVPGLLFIDTPGHHAFTTLRARGGALAEMAILVIDVNERFQPQTLEALEILRNCRTPFVVAATKIDRTHGWRVHENEPFGVTFPKQGERSRDALENRTYQIVGRLSELGFASERYDRISDFQRNIAIVPVSSHTGEGIADLLMVLIGLAQRFLKQDLAFRADGPARGTVLEVKEERGLGITLDVILYDGTLSVGDEVMLASSGGVVTAKVRSLLAPRPLREIRVEDRFDRVRSVVAAAGIKVAAPGLEQVVAGSPLMAVQGDRGDLEATIRREMESIKVTLSEKGITVKADTIGALEALSKELEGKSIGILRASVGPVARHDIVEVQTVSDPLASVLLSFNTPILPDAQELLRDPAFAHVKVFSGKVIYQLINDYLAWRDAEIRKKEAQRFEQVVLPARLMILPDCVFRQSNPAVVGVRVLLGKLRAGVDLIDRAGKPIGHLKTMQSRGENIREADAGAEVAVSIEGATVGRQVNVNDELMVDIPERHVKILEHEMFARLSPSMRECLEDYTTLRRRDEPFWGK